MLQGPGGQRADRSTIATPYAIYLADSNWRRLKDNVPIRDLVEHWGDNFFNHGGFWIRDLQSWQSLPMDEVHRARWSFLKPYYGSQLNEIPDKDPTAWDYNVELRVAAQGSYDKTPEWARDYYYDRKNMSFWNGWGVDAHHAYQLPAYHTLLFSSAVHVFAAKQAYTSVHTHRRSGTAEKITLSAIASCAHCPFCSCLLCPARCDQLGCDDAAGWQEAGQGFVHVQDARF